MDKHVKNATKGTSMVLGAIALVVLMLWGLVSLIEWTIDTHHEAYFFGGLCVLGGVLVISLIWCNFYEESVRRG